MDSSDLINAESYLDIHAKTHQPRTNDNLSESYEERIAKGVTHVNGVAGRSLFYEFPFFNVPQMLPQVPFMNKII